MKIYMRISYVAIVAAALLLVSIAGVGPSIASDDDDDKGKGRVEATGEFERELISEYHISDFDRTRLIKIKSTGTLSGTFIGPQTLHINSTEPWGSFGHFVVTFHGTVDESDLGTFSAIITENADSSKGVPIPIKQTFVIIEGSGMDGLQGICGGGTTEGIWTGAYPIISTYDFNIRFGDACRAND